MRIATRILCLTLSLMIFCAPAHAAPLRETREMCLTDGEMMELSSLLDIYMQAALFKDIDTLAPGEAPSPGYVEDVLRRVISMGLFALEGLEEADGVATASRAALESLYGQLFASDDFAPPAQTESPLVRLVGDGMAFDISADGEHYIGAHPYEAVQTGEGVLVRADVFLAGAGFTGDIEEAHEDEITWLAGYEILLVPNAQSAYGYTLGGYACQGAYHDVSYYEYVSEEDGYSITLPSLFDQQAMQPTEYGMRCAAQDGAIFEIGVKPNPHGLSVDAYMLEWQSEHPGADTELSEEFSYFTGAFTSGEVQLFVMAYVVGERVYMYELQFPVEHAAEYTLYAEFLRNSFVVSDLSVG